MEEAKSLATHQQEKLTEEARSTMNAAMDKWSVVEEAHRVALAVGFEIGILG